jgi:hypothetical protein
MYLRSRYPDVEPYPEANMYHYLRNRPNSDQQAWPDYTLHVDGITGYKRTYRQFLHRVRDGMTALASPASQGGLGLSASKGDMIGIFSDNCMVS